MRVNDARSPVIAGLGMTEMGKVYGRTAEQLAGSAVRAAAADAGIALAEIDGLLVNPGLSDRIGLGLARALGMRDLRMLSEVQVFGASAGAMVQYASMAVMSGMATAVACVFADTPLRAPGERAGAAYGGSSAPSGTDALNAAFNGVLGAVPLHALAARRHMEKYGTRSEQLGAIAVAQRAWAAMNPLAQMRTPISLDDHQASRWIAEPLHLLDCCLVSNGAIAVVVTTAERAASMAQPPVRVIGWGQGHPGHPQERGSDLGLVSGAAISGPTALAMAGLSIRDVDVVQLYDCYTYTVLVQLEDYGFCDKGEGGAFVSSGVLEPGGGLPVNTGGGQLSGYYMWGMTPLSEAVIQCRGQAGERQARRHDTVLVSGSGGRPWDYHSTLVLSR